MQARENALKEWLIYTLKQRDFDLIPLVGDASFRRYYRLHCSGSSYVIMDAPPSKEDIKPFVSTAQTLKKAGIPIPEIHAADLEQGFLLLSDLGDRLLLDALQLETANTYYQKAISTLIRIQSCSTDDPVLPSFNKSHMLDEMNLCIEWFFKSYLDLDLKQDELSLVLQTMDWIAEQVAQQPLVFIHRDYHSRNLMLINEHNDIVLGVIDFQDAMRGPLTYDLVSLLKDCYIAWPRTQVLEWVNFFYTHQSAASNHYSLAEFIRAFDLCGLQRHLKVLGIFARLYLRDHKPGYLKHLPLTLKYVCECTEIYTELHPFFHILQKRVYLP